MDRAPENIIDADFEVVAPAREAPKPPVQRELEPGEAMFNAIVPPGTMRGSPFAQVVQATALVALLIGLAYSATWLYRAVMGA